MSEPLLGRDQILREIRALVAEARARCEPAVIRIAGPAGIGKTTLLDSLRRSRRGRRIWIAAGHEYGITSAELDRRLGSAESRNVYVDDLHALDEVTLFAILSAVQRRDPALSFFFTDRRDDAPELGRHSTVCLGPLPSSAARDLVLRLNPDASLDALSAIIASGSGVPFVLQFLAVDARERAYHGPAEHGSALPGVIAKRLNRCSRPALDIVRLSSVLDDPVRIRTLADALGLNVAEVAVAASDLRDLLVVDDLRINFRHALLRDAVRAQIVDPVPLFRRLLDSYAEEIDAVEDLRAVLRCAVGSGDDVRATNAALRAARLHAGCGALETARSLLETAMRHARRPLPAEYAAEYAGVLQRLSRDQIAAEFLRPLLRDSIERDDAESAATLLGSFSSAALTLERFEELATLTERIEQLRSATDDTRARIRTIRSSCAAWAGRLETFDEMMRQGPLEWSDRRAEAFAASLRGNDTVARTSFEIYQAQLRPLHAQLSIADRAVRATLGLFAEGNTALAQADDAWAHDGERGGYPTGTAMRILARLNDARWDEASAIIDTVPLWDDAYEEPLIILDVRLLYAAITGRPIVYPHRAARSIRKMIARGQRRHAIGAALSYCVATRREESSPPPDIAAFALRALSVVPMPYLIGSVPVTISLAAAIVGRDQAEEVLVREPPFKSRWHAAHHQLARGLLRDDAVALREARASFDTLSMPAFAMVAGLALPVPRATDVALAQRLHYGRSNEEKRNSSPLTGRERDVSELAAGGASNRDIAASLKIAERTVEVHLTSVYKKLGVRSRSALASRILRRDV